MATPSNVRVAGRGTGRALAPPAEVEVLVEPEVDPEEYSDTVVEESPFKLLRFLGAVGRSRRITVASVG
jgi:hypothetical protein